MIQPLELQKLKVFLVALKIGKEPPKNLLCYGLFSCYYGLLWINILLLITPLKSEGNVGSHEMLEWDLGSPRTGPRICG